MAVLVEAISVIVRCDSIHRLYPGGWEQFVNDAPNRTLCSDTEIARIGFMVPDDVESFVKQLEKIGFTYLQDGMAIDVVVADQQRGLMVQCNWAEFGKIDYTGKGDKVSACRLVGSSGHTLMTPDGWEFQGSLSQTFGFVPNGASRTGLKFLRHENGTDVYYDSLVGKEVYVGRAGA